MLRHLLFVCNTERGYKLNFLVRQETQFLVRQETQFLVRQETQFFQKTGFLKD
jgi:hypothetical protein